MRKRVIIDPADLLPFSKDIIIGEGEIIPKDPMPNELSASGKLRPVLKKRVLLFAD